MSKDQEEKLRESKRNLLKLWQLAHLDDCKFTITKEPQVEGGYPFPDLSEEIEGETDVPSHYWIYTNNERTKDTLLGLVKRIKPDVSSLNKDGSTTYKISFNGDLMKLIGDGQECDVDDVARIAHSVGYTLAPEGAKTKYAPISLDDFPIEERTIGANTLFPLINANTNGKEDDRFSFALCPVQEREGMHYALIARLDHSHESKTRASSTDEIFAKYLKPFFPSPIASNSATRSPAHEAKQKGMVSYGDATHEDGTGEVAAAYIPDYLVEALRATYGDTLPELSDVMKEMNSERIEQHDDLKVPAQDLLSEKPISLFNAVHIAGIAMPPLVPLYRNSEPARKTEQEIEDGRVAKPASSYLKAFAECSNKCGLRIEHKRKLDGSFDTYLTFNDYPEGTLFEHGLSPEELIYKLSSSKHCYTNPESHKEHKPSPIAIWDASGSRKYTLGSGAIGELRTFFKAALIEETVPFSINTDGFRASSVPRHLGADIIEIEPKERKKGARIKERESGNVETSKLILQPYPKEDGTQGYAVYIVARAFNAQHGDLEYKLPVPRSSNRHDSQHVDSFNKQQAGRIGIVTHKMQLSKSTVHTEIITEPGQIPMVARLDVSPEVFMDIKQQCASLTADENFEYSDRITIAEAAQDVASLSALDAQLKSDLGMKFIELPKKPEEKRVEKETAKKKKGPAPKKKEKDDAKQERGTLAYNAEQLINVVGLLSEGQEYDAACLGTFVSHDTSASKTELLSHLTKQELDELPEGSYKITKRSDNPKERASTGANRYLYTVEHYKERPSLQPVIWFRVQKGQNILNSRSGPNKPTRLETCGIYDKKPLLEVDASISEKLVAYPIPPAIYTELEDKNDIEVLDSAQPFYGDEIDEATETRVTQPWGTPVTSPRNARDEVKKHFNYLEKASRDIKQVITKEDAVDKLRALFTSRHARVTDVIIDDGFRAALRENLKLDRQALENAEKRSVTIAEGRESIAQRSTQKAIPGVSEEERGLSQSTLSEDQQNKAAIARLEALVETREKYQAMFDKETGDIQAYVIPSKGPRTMENMQALYEKYDLLYMPPQPYEGVYRDQSGTKRDAFVLYPKQALTKALQSQEVNMKPLREEKVRTQKGGGQSVSKTARPVPLEQIARYMGTAFGSYVEPKRQSGNEAVRVSKQDRGALGTLLNSFRHNMTYSAMRIEPPSTKGEGKDTAGLEYKVGSQPCLTLHVDKHTSLKELKNLCDLLAQNKGLKSPFKTADKTSYTAWAILPDTKAIATVKELTQRSYDLKDAEQFLTQDLFYDYSQANRMLEEAHHIGVTEFNAWDTVFFHLRERAMRAGLLGEDIAREYGNEEDIAAARKTLESGGFIQLLEKNNVLVNGQWNDPAQMTEEQKLSFAEDFVENAQQIREDKQSIISDLNYGLFGDDLSEKDVEEAISALRDACATNKDLEDVKRILNDRDSDSYEKLYNVIDSLYGEMLPKVKVQQLEGTVFELNEEGEMSEIDAKNLQKTLNKDPRIQHKGGITLSIFCDRHMPKDLAGILNGAMHNQRRSFDRTDYKDEARFATDKDNNTPFIDLRGKLPEEIRSTARAFTEQNREKQGHGATEGRSTA